MKILVTGATGFVGQHLVSKLSKYNYKLVVRNISSNYKNGSQILYKTDDLEVFRKRVKEYNPDVVIHLASFLTSADDITNIKNIIDSNIFFTSILLESLKDTDVKIFINTGSFAEYYDNQTKPNPAYFYSASKLAVRPIIQYFKNIIGFKSINIIPYTIYGGKSKSKKVIDFIMDSTKSEIPVDMTSGEQVLDFIHVEDVVNFYVHCLENIELLKDGSDYHLGTGTGTSVKEIATFIENITSKKANINWGAREYRPLDIMRAIAPINILEKELNWKPKVSIEDGIKKIIGNQL